MHAAELLVPIAAVASAIIASAFTVAASQLRQRGVGRSAEGIQAAPDEEREGLAEQPQPEAGPASTRVSLITLVVAAAIAAAAAAAALAAISILSPGGTAPGPGRCPRSPSVRARLKHATSLGFTHRIWTRSHKAQRLFDLGLVEAWNFNQLEAHAAFSAAAALDPRCSRCWWGIAHALGPGANRAVVAEPQPYPSFSPADFPQTRAAAHQAWQLAEAALRQDPDSEPAKRDVLWGRAIVARFRDGSDRQPGRDAAEAEYAALIEAIGERYQDADAFAIAAETQMNLSPWDYYEDKEYRLRPNAVAAEQLIHRALALQPRHPLAAHLLIHLAEASDPRRNATVSAARAEEAAEHLLDSKSPVATMGHLLHMPSHTYVRIGRWHDAVVSNIRAYEADLQDARACRTPYVPEHNTDMLIYAAIQGGEGAVARTWAAKIRTHQQVLHTAAYGDSSRSWTHLPLVQAAFADWKAILATPAPPPTARDNCPSPGAHSMATAVWHYTRGLAYAAPAAGADEGGAAQQAALVASELAQFQAAAAEVPEEQATLPGEWPGIYACDRRKLLAIYGGTLRAALSALQGDLNATEAHLRAAAAVEDGMGYMEPPRLFQPVRQCLGAVLLRLGRAAEAQQVFREDLAVHPSGGRSLAGLALALQAQGRQQEADALRAGELAAAWQHADVPAVPCPQFTLPS